MGATKTRRTAPQPKFTPRRFAGSKSIAENLVPKESPQPPAPAVAAAPAPSPTAPAPAPATSSSSGLYTTGNPEFDADQVALDLAKKKWDEQPTGSPERFAAYKEYSALTKSISDKAVSRNLQ